MELNDEKPNSTVHSTSQVLQTKDHMIFKKLTGNRLCDPQHVKKLKKNMMNVGNLTAEFPIVVNENMEIIDGQHRLQALKELNWPVGYRMQTGLTLETVRGINQAGQNWSWKDYMNSYIGGGTPEQKDQYGRFMALYKHFNYQYAVLTHYCGLGEKGRVGGVMFNIGELHIPNQERTFELLKRYKEVSEALSHHTRPLAIAMYKILQNPDYNHERMVRKAKLWDSPVKNLANTEDYQRFLETVYNRHMGVGAQVRLY